MSTHAESKSRTKVTAKHAPTAMKGTLRSFNFSPKGGIEGLLIDHEGSVNQVNVSPDVGALVVKMLHVGKPVEVTVASEKEHHEGTHPVFRLNTIRNHKGETLTFVDGAVKPSKVKGEVQRLNYAKHGEPNGVVLASGDFIHLRPEGMERLKLKVGDEVEAEGREQLTVLGSKVIEASKVNGKTLAKPKKHH